MARYGMRYTTHARVETAEQALAAHEKRHGPEALAQKDEFDINDLVDLIGEELPDVF